MSTATLKDGEIVAGKYRIEGVIGVGAMGAVYSALHTGLQQRVAIKVLLTELAERPDSAERFRREAIAAASIRGEHACRVLDVGTHESGVPYMVMERLEGHNLATELERRGKIPYPQAIGYVLQACEALAEAHVLDIVHRDVKPANLFLARTVSGSHKIKVLDFGVAKSIAVGPRSDPALTQTSGFVGSPMYTSPEQLNAVKDLDARCDVWSLGVVLYELITGAAPFRGSSFAELVGGILYREPRPLREHGVDVPAELIEVIERALSKRREDRFASVGELADALAAFVPEEDAASVQRTYQVLQAATATGRGHVARTQTAPGVESYRASALRRLRATRAARRRRALGPYLLALGLTAALVVGGALLVWNRHGAPTAPAERDPPVASAPIATPVVERPAVEAPLASPPSAPQALPAATGRPINRRPAPAVPAVQIKEAPAPATEPPTPTLRDYGGRR